MNAPFLKVCGLTQTSQILELIPLNIDFIGFIFYEKSPRYVLNHLSLEQISEIPHSKKVGVFVNENLDHIFEISEKADLNLIQLHGDESSHFILELRKKLNPKIKIIKVIRIGNQTPDELQKIINDQSSDINYLLFDTDSKAFGGTGKPFDWNIIQNLNLLKPYFLSGGISNDNVHEIFEKGLKPYALDINSKFEIEPGIKDLEKIKQLKKIINESQRDDLI